MQQCISQLQGGKSAPTAAPLDLLISRHRFTNLLIAESFDPGRSHEIAPIWRRSGFE
jgi:hypothetical protein